jgi:prepilin-type N-terminal cleavage/methylation domain-containing protein
MNILKKTNRVDMQKGKARTVMINLKRLETNYTRMNLNGVPLRTGFTHTPTLPITRATTWEVHDRNCRDGCLSTKSMMVCGFTLIELLVVISIISLLSSVVFASLSDAREKGRIAAAQKFSSSMHHAIGDELVGEWTFDNDTLVDTSGFNHVGLAQGGFNVPADFVDGVMARAIELNGVSEYIGLNNDYWRAVFNDNTDWTISAWVKPAAYVDSSIVGQRYSTSVILGMRNTGKLFFGVDDIRRESSSALTLGKWQHVTVTYTNPEHEAVLYIDGEIVYSGVTYDGSGIGSGDNNLAIGWQMRNDPGMPTYFNGSIDDVRIYSKAFNLAQIQKLYAESAQKYLTLNQ